MIDDGGTVAGWYPDPWRTAPLRWWDGAGWTGYLTVEATPRPASRLDLAKEHDSARQVRWAAWLIGLGQLAALVVFSVMAHGFVEVIRFSIDHPSSDDVPPGVSQLIGASTMSTLVSPLSLIGLVMVLIWFHRAVTNGIALGYRQPREPALAVVSWFIPIVNFWWPYESLRECVGPNAVATRALIKRWWLVYLAAAFGLLLVPAAVLWLPLLVVLAAGAVALVVYEVRLLQRLVASVLADHTAVADGLTQLPAAKDASGEPIP